MPHLNPPLLEVEHLRTHFQTSAGVVPAVNDVSFTLAAGETLGLVGESGCGKTVTALSILRLIPAGLGQIAGKIRLEGQDLMGLSPAQMRHLRGNRISMVFQEPMTALNPVLTIGDQIAEVLRQHRRLGRQAAANEAVNCLSWVGMPDARRRLTQYPHELSGGLRQRALIAMALACQPPLLIADEPTTALDVTIQAQILALMTRLKADLQMAMLLITHNLGIVAQIADRLAVMYAGVIVESAPTAQLFARPRHPYTQGLLASVPRLDFTGPRHQQLYAIPGQVPNPQELPPGCPFQPRCPQAMETCRQPPPWVEVESDHGVGCWLFN
ncbi:MAG: ABC transporter ATP-binding protein [Desulfobacca sp.]|nr:ABC transporter ATP-binding protein [Desulfobacca sp.]